jgi:hypothetical protein
MNFVTPKVGAKHELLFNELASEVGLLTSMLDLSSTTKCDPSHISKNHEFGHT